MTHDTHVQIYVMVNAMHVMIDIDLLIEIWEWQLSLNVLMKTLNESHYFLQPDQADQQFWYILFGSHTKI